jgi:hypothetical protein
MNEAIEDGIGVSRIANDFVPAVYWNLGGNHRRAVSVAFFEDFQKIMAGCGVRGSSPQLSRSARPRLSVRDERIPPGRGSRHRRSHGHQTQAEIALNHLQQVN